MGNFFAHIFPGSVFFFMGCWYLFNSLRNFHLQEVYVHQNVFSKPLEPLGKILVCIVGMLTECFSADWLLFMKEESTKDSADWQHFTMYLLFMITGLCDIICSKYKRVGRTISYMSYISAYLIESALFLAHLHGRPMLDVQCHKLIAYSGIGVSLTLIYLLYNPSSIVATALYCSLIVVHGLWFCEVAFIILSPFKNTSWKMDSAAHAMLANVFFCWTFLGVVVLMSGVAVVLDKHYKYRDNRTRHIEMNGLLESE